MQNFMIICQGVPEVSVRTNRQTQVKDLLCRLVRLFFTRLLRRQKKVFKWTKYWFLCYDAIMKSDMLGRTSLSGT